VTKPVDVSSVLFFHMPTATAEELISVILMHSVFQYHVSPLTNSILHAAGRAVGQFQCGCTGKEALFFLLKVHLNVLSINLLCGCVRKVS